MAKCRDERLLERTEHATVDMPKYILVNELPEAGDTNMFYITPVTDTDIYEVYAWNGSDYMLVGQSADYQLAKAKWDFLFDEYYPTIEGIIQRGNDWDVEIAEVYDDEEEV